MLVDGHLSANVGKFRWVVERMPVRVIVDPRAALRGAIVVAGNSENTAPRDIL